MAINITRRDLLNGMVVGAGGLLVKAYAEGRHDTPRLACVSEFTMVAVQEQSDGSYKKCFHELIFDD